MPSIARRRRAPAWRRFVRSLFYILWKVLRVFFLIAAAMGPGMPPPPPPPPPATEQVAEREGLDKD